MLPQQLSYGARKDMMVADPGFETAAEIELALGLPLLRAVGEVETGYEPDNSKAAEAPRAWR